MILDTFAILKVLKSIGSDEENKRRASEIYNQEIFEGALCERVQEKLKEMFPKTWQAYNVADYNLEKKIVEKKSKSYVRPPVRKLNKADETDKYNEILGKFSFNDAMKLMDRLKNQHLYCALGIIRNRVITEAGEPIDDFTFWALAPHEFCVYRDENDEIAAWAIPTGKDDKYSYWTLWSKESHLKLKTKDYKSFEIVPIPGNDLMVNPYGVIPFIYVPMDMTGKYPRTSSLPRQTVEVNTNLSIYLSSGNMQIGQLVLKYAEDKPISHIVSGLMTAIKLPQPKSPTAPKTEASYISPTPNLEGHKDSILTFMQLILDEHGINSNSVIRQGENFTSGFDRLLASADVQDIIEDNQDMYTRVENAAYKIIKAMHDRDKSFIFTSDELKVTFSRPKILISDSEKLENLRKKKDLGLWEEWELVVDADPNLTEQEAKDKVERLRKGRNDNQERSGLQGNTAETSELPE